ncbi:MAG TPA: type IV pilus assembly protein PilM [Verrucomicrobiae bacterium]|nr:type IV pilus assembly protein PilM [Verrucomicrobiae bacterium]
MNILRKPKITTGLDIGASSIKLVQLEKKTDGYILRGLGIKEVPAEALVADEIKDRDTLIFNIQSLVDQVNPKTKDVVISISGHGVITDKISIDKKTGSEAEQAILFEAEQRAPFDVEDVTMDYHIISTNEETSKMDVLLVAARQEFLKNYLDLLNDTGLRPVVIDTDAFAVLNAYEINYDIDPNRVLALVNIGFDTTNVIFVKDKLYHSTRDVGAGTRLIYDTIQKEFRLNHELATKALRGELETSLDQDMLKATVVSASEELFSGIEVAFSYFKSSAKVEQIDWIFLSGGGALVPFLPEFMQAKLSVPVDIVNPLRNIDYDPDEYRQLELERIAPLLTVPIGLAARKVK